jgi:aspartate ammonia-lyase
VQAYIHIKKAYALANRNHTGLEDSAFKKVLQAADEILSGNYQIKFVPEPLPTACCIALNNSINDALVVRSQELIGDSPRISAKEHINLNQENSIVFSLAAKLSVVLALAELQTNLLHLERLLRRESLTLSRVLKVNFIVADQSSTAEWGKRLNIFATAIETVLMRLKESVTAFVEPEHPLENLSLLAAKSDNPDALVLAHLAELTGYRLKDEDYIGQNNVWQNTFIISDLLLIACALKDLALILSRLASVAKIVNSIASEENADSGDKQNVAKLLADGVKMSASQAISQNLSFTFLAQNEQLEGDLLLPLLNENLLTIIRILRAAVLTFTEKGLLSPV